MWSALNFGNPAHRVIWNLEEIRKRITIILEFAKGNKIPADISKDVWALIGKYFAYEEELKGVPHF